MSTFINNAWYVAAWAEEVAERPLARRIFDEPIVLFRDADGPPPRSPTCVVTAAHR